METQTTITIDPQVNTATTIPEPPPVPSAPVTESRPESPSAPEPDIATIVAEAEQRGYIRGRNESIARLMQQPPGPELDDIPDSSVATPVPHTVDPDILILNTPRSSIWARDSY